MFLKVAALAGTAPPHPKDGARPRVALLSVGWTLGFSLACSRWTGSDGRTAAWMDGINLLLLGGYAWRAGDRMMGRLLAAAGAFGAVELLADFLCVRCTGTLDYAVTRSTLPAIPMDKVIANELELFGSHGMPAHRYDAMLAMIASGKLAPEKLVNRMVNLEQSIEVLSGMERSGLPGIAVITDFS